MLFNSNYEYRIAVLWKEINCFTLKAIFMLMTKHLIEDKISIIKEVANAITSTSNLDSIVNLILDLALLYTNASRGYILLPDKKGELVVNTSRGIDPELLQVIRENKGEYITGSFICSPILMKDKLMGVICIIDKIGGGDFTKDETDLINILASQTAISLEQARLISELRSKALELDERNKGLIDTDRLKTEFIVRMSHELRTPLNSIKGAVYYLKEKKPSEAEQAEFIDIVSDETNKLINLLNGLLNFPRLENEEATLKRKILILKEILEEAISTRIIQESLAESKVSIKLICPDFPCDIVGEKIQLLQSFIHIIDGAMKYTSAGDVIEIVTGGTETSVEVRLLIKGRTIPDSEVPFIFDERCLWYGVDINKDKMKFYLAKKTIESHKGTISVFNSPEGIFMLLAFPRNQEDYCDAEINELMNLFLSFTASAMNINKCSLMLSDELTGELTIRSAIGIDKEIIKNTRLMIGESIAGRVSVESRPLLVQDIEKDRRIHKKNAPQYNTKSFLSLPLVINNKTIGVLNFNNKANGENFNTKDLYLALVITDRIAHLIGKVLRGDLKNEEYKLTVKGIESLLNAERMYKKKNGRLSDLVTGIMQNLGQDEEEIKLALYASRVYDLGLTQVDESILSKTGGLSDIEKKIVRTHPFPGVRLIESVEHDETLKKIVLHHHERYDGSGYPEGLKGDEIPLISRVISVVDAYTAMTADRPYRKAFGAKESLRRIVAGAGNMFDPEIVEALTELV